LSILAEEHERTLDYLNSPSRKKIQELGRTRETNLLIGEGALKHHSGRAQLRNNKINPRSLPRLQEGDTSLNRDISLQQIIRSQLSKVTLTAQLKTFDSVPRNVSDSMHKKQHFGKLNVPSPSPPPQTIYSKSSLVKMILENDRKTRVLNAASPVINVTEAIHGTFKTNFVLAKKDPAKVGLPLGRLNESRQAQKAIFATQQSRSSIQYLPEKDDHNSASVSSIVNGALAKSYQKHGSSPKFAASPSSILKTYSSTMPLAGASQRELEKESAAGKQSEERVSALVKYQI